MKVTVINGNMRHGSTWHCMDLFRQELSKYEEVTVKEFLLPKDLPNLCVGCFSCFFKGEHTCPHTEKMSPIIESLIEADLIIMTSPVYAGDVSGSMKTLLDHLSFMWMSHRPNASMFHKAALTISTTAGAGITHTTKTMTSSLSFWGIRKIFVFKKAVAAMKWDDVSEKNKARINARVVKMTKKIYKTVHNIDKAPYPLFRKFLFHIMRAMHKGNDWNPIDRNHWDSQGWLSGVKPY